MTLEEAINTLNSIKQYYNDKNEDSYVGFDNEDNEAIDMAFKALEQEPCEDAISREDAMSMILCYGNEIKAEVMDDIKASMIKLPSVTPKAKIDEIIKRIEQARDKDQIAEYPYNRCIKIIREVLGDD